MLQMIRNLSVEHLFLSMQPLLLGSLAKWSVLFTVIFLLLAIYKKLSSDVRHVVLLLLIYAVVLIPLANAIFPLEWFGDTNLTRQGNEITNTISTTLASHNGGGMGQSVIVADTTQESFVLPTSTAAFNWSVILSVIWGVGIIASSTGLIIGRSRIGVLCRKHCEQPTSSEEKELKALMKKLGIRRRVGLVISNESSIPFTFRVFNPLVVLPRTSESWPQELVRAVLFHELCHIRRGDYLTKLIARMICSLFWFLPFLWISFSRLSQEQETACDLSVLQRGMRPTEYARHILDVASISIRNLAYQGSFLAEGRKRSIERRINHALKFNRAKIKMGGSNMKTTKLVLVCVLLIAAIAIIGSSASNRRTITENDNKVLIVLRESGETGDKELMITKEAIEITRLLEEAGYQATMASASGRTFLGGSPPSSFKTLKLSKVKVSDYEAFIFPSDNRKSLYRDKENATPEEIAIVKQAVDEGKLVAAQRWGVVVLAEAGVLEETKFVFPLNPQEDERFGNAVNNWTRGELIVQDKNIITTSLCPYANPGIELTNALIDAFEE